MTMWLVKSDYPNEIVTKNSQKLSFEQMKLGHSFCKHLNQSGQN